MLLDTLLYKLAKPLLFRLDAEQAHDLVSALLRQANHAPLALAVLRARYAQPDPLLAVRCAGLNFVNPLGVAAGFDKRGALTGVLGALGFGHVEIGTVTPRPQPGNDRPRMFRLPEHAALINRLGFNSSGMVAVARTLQTTTQQRPVIGANIGKNRTTALEDAAQDYVAAFLALAPLCDYVTLNISSPNTPGLRKLHDATAVDGLLAAVTTMNQRRAQPLPIFVKVSPDEPDEALADVVSAAQRHGVAGLIATNTTLARPAGIGPMSAESGGLSGAPLRERSRAVIAQLYKTSHGTLPIIGVGGVFTAADAYGHIRAGASLVQLYTGLVYGGPATAHGINTGLIRLLRRDGFVSVAEAVGA